MLGERTRRHHRSTQLDISADDITFRMVINILWEVRILKKDAYIIIDKVYSNNFDMRTTSDPSCRREDLRKIFSISLKGCITTTICHFAINSILRYLHINCIFLRSNNSIENDGHEWEMKNETYSRVCVRQGNHPRLWCRSQITTIDGSKREDDEDQDTFQKNSTKE